MIHPGDDGDAAELQPSAVQASAVQGLADSAISAVGAGVNRSSVLVRQSTMGGGLSPNSVQKAVSAAGAAAGAGAIAAVRNSVAGAGVNAGAAYSVADEVGAKLRARPKPLKRKLTWASLGVTKDDYTDNDTDGQST
jgi:hypothetical protein